eukprot:1668455-Prymnesium_polylepis.1
MRKQPPGARTRSAKSTPSGGASAAISCLSVGAPERAGRSPAASSSRLSTPSSFSLSAAKSTSICGSVRTRSSPKETDPSASASRARTMAAASAASASRSVSSVAVKELTVTRARAILSEAARE